jgi:predicted permease
MFKQLFTETMVLCLAGGTLGLLFAYWGKVAIGRLLAASDTGLRFDTSLDLKVLGFAILATFLASIFSGAFPALKSGNIDPLGALKEAGDQIASRSRIGRFLVVGQMALSLILVALAGLYSRTLSNLLRIDPGFSVERLLVFKVSPRDSGYKADRWTPYLDQVQRELALIPGVASATLSNVPLLRGGMSGEAFLLEGSKVEYDAATLLISESFFSTMGVPIVLGRNLLASDRATSPRVVVVNQALVRKCFGHVDPIGQSIEVSGNKMEVVGVCGDIKYSDIRTPVLPTLYIPFRQQSEGSVFFALRTAVSPDSVASSVTKALASIDSNVPATEMATEEQLRDTTIGQQRSSAMSCVFLAILALILSSIGLFGLTSYEVTSRTKEIGIRVALGATRRQIMRPMWRDALFLSGIGAIVGLPLGLFLATHLDDLYEVKSDDPYSFGLALFSLFAVASLASWVPIRKAISVDPIVALRRE